MNTVPTGPLIVMVSLADGESADVVVKPTVQVLGAKAVVGFSANVTPVTGVVHGNDPPVAGFAADVSALVATENAVFGYEPHGFMTFEAVTVTESPAPIAIGVVMVTSLAAPCVGVAVTAVGPAGVVWSVTV